jgi:hypothetical protein
LDLFDVDVGADLAAVLNAREAAFVAKYPDMLKVQYTLPASHKGVAEELRAQHATLERFDSKDGMIELDHEEYGIQISIFENAISVTVPYWHGGEKARRVFEEIWRYLTVIESQTGYRAVDQQVGRVLDLSHDFSVVLSAYTEAMSRQNDYFASED